MMLTSRSAGTPVVAARSIRSARAARGPVRTMAVVAGEASADTYYEVNLEKPLGMKFARGRDGGAYVISIDARRGNLDDRIKVGDKIEKVSASFGDEVWDALNYGQVVYAIKTRSGGVYMKMKDMKGDMSALEGDEADAVEKMFRAERAGGNYGAGTKEIQQRNYMTRKEAERKRRELFDDALSKFRKGSTEEALIMFENVVSMEPKNYVGDNFARTSPVFRVAQYNVACSYSVLNQTQAALEALDACMAAGFEDFAKIRSDPNLENVRKSPKFRSVIEKYDEPVINTEAFDAIKNLFSFGKKN